MRPRLDARTTAVLLGSLAACAAPQATAPKAAANVSPETTAEKPRAAGERTLPQSPESETAEPRAAGVSRQIEPRPPRTYANVRVGLATSSARPELCLELSPLDRLSIEGCGTGSGFLHDDAEPEVAHFRGTVRFFELPVGDAWLVALATVGFAELQQGADQPGFQFTSTDPTRTATAGAEVGASLRYVDALIGGVNLLIVLQGSVAYMPHAPRLRAPSTVLQPTGSLTLGVGY